MRHPIALLKAGSTFPALKETMGDFEDWICKGMRLSKDRVRIIDLRRHERLPETSTISAAVITGSHEMVTHDAVWMKTAEIWLQSAIAKGLPVLGICFGHQLLAKAMGGIIDWNPKGLELGTFPISLTKKGLQDILLGQLPASFLAHLAHSQSIIALPPGACRLATGSGNQNQAFSIGSAWGVQFHPEFDETVMLGYSSILAESSGHQTQGYTQSPPIKPAHEPSTLLYRFYLMAQKQAESEQLRSTKAKHTIP